jgi:hypothetical protein
VPTFHSDICARPWTIEIYKNYRIPKSRNSKLCGNFTRTDEAIEIYENYRIPELANPKPATLKTHNFKTHNSKLLTTFHLGPMLLFLKIFSPKSRPTKFAFFYSKQSYFFSFVISLVFEKNAIFFAENCRKRITSIPRRMKQGTDHRCIF